MAGTWPACYLVNDEAREYFDKLADGDPEVTADAEQLLGMRRHDSVADCPADKLADLVAACPFDRRVE